MITFLNGTLAGKREETAVIAVGGVGFKVTIPLTTYRELPRINEPVTLFTYLYLREDEMRLYGFYTEEEREMFELLMTVSGVGAKMAVDVVSYLPVGQFIHAVLNGEHALLCQVPGIGKKRAERLIFDLKSSNHPLFLRAAVQPVGKPQPVSSSTKANIAEAVSALIALGLKSADANRAVVEAVKITGDDADVNTLLKEGLKHR